MTSSFKIKMKLKIINDWGIIIRKQIFGIHLIPFNAHDIWHVTYDVVKNKEKKFNNLQ